jgi:nitrogen regulatory protein P-II 1
MISRMKKMEAVIRVERLRLVQKRIKELKIGGIILHASGWSKSRELHARYRGLPVSYDLIPVAKVEVIVPDDKIDLVVNTIKESARTGEVGDGVIVVSNLESFINIATMDDSEKQFE